MKINIEIPPKPRSHAAIALSDGARRGMRALCIADIHEKSQFLTALENFLSKEKFDLVFTLGDIVNFGRNMEYFNQFIKIIENSKLPMFWVPGNNDVGDVYKVMSKSRYSVENKLKKFKDLPADASRPAMQAGEKIVGMGGVPDLYGHNIYYPEVAAEDFAGCIFLSHIPPRKVKDLKKFDHGTVDRSIKVKNAPKIQISGHLHHLWGVGYIGQTKILNLPAGLDMMVATLDTETLAIKFIDMKKYDRVSLS